MREIRSYEKEHLTPLGIRVGFAGDVAVSQSLIQGIVRTQLQSLFWSLVGIWAVTTVLGRSLRWGIYCVLPSALAVLINFAVMGWMGIPLGVATSMFAGMTLGIGVDLRSMSLKDSPWPAKVDYPRTEPSPNRSAEQDPRSQSIRSPSRSASGC